VAIRSGDLKLSFTYYFRLLDPFLATRRIATSARLAIINSITLPTHIFAQPSLSETHTKCKNESYQTPAILDALGALAIA
jgi:hypothetical protein